MTTEQFIKEFKEDVVSRMDRLENKLDGVLDNCKYHAAKLGENKVYNKITWTLFTLLAGGEVFLAIK